MTEANFTSSPQDSGEPGHDMLLIGASFFGYLGKLIAALEARGRRPIWFEDRPGIDTMTKLMLRLAPRLMDGRVSAHVGDIVEKVRHQPIRDILVIKGEGISEDHLRTLRKLFPDAKFTLYLWDSYGNMPSNTPAKVAHFDVAYSFDRRDVDGDPCLQYRPLFYLPEFACLPVVETDIDLLFLGTVHSDRFEVTERLARSLPPEIRFERVCYFPSKKLFYVKRTFRPTYWRAGIDQFTFTPISRQAVLDLLARSRAVLDIERAVQTGFTMRTIEAVGGSKKLATTNPAIAEADFYHPENQVVLDRSRPRLPDDFLRTSYRPIEADTYRRYSLGSFLDDLGYTSNHADRP